MGSIAYLFRGVTALKGRLKAIKGHSGGGGRHEQVD